MKTKWFFIIATFWGGINLSAQVINIPNSANVATMNGDITAIDINNDGLLDIIFSCGSQWEKPCTKFSARYINNGDNTFTMQLETKIVPGAMASIHYGDVDGNGDIDAIFSGIINGDADVAKETQGIVYNISGENKYQFTPTQRVSGLGDWNNDGRQDYFCLGKYNGIYYNLGNDVYELDMESPYNDYAYGGPEAVSLDWDNDGDLDIFITSWEVGKAAGYRSLILRNDGNYIFTELSLDVIPVGAGSVDFADINGDGYLDILLNGQNAIDNAATMYTCFLYLSDGKGGISMSDVNFKPYYTWSIGDGMKFADWNNDGKFDVIISGTNGLEMKLDIYINNGDGTSFTLLENSLIPGVTNSSIEVADLNNDGKIDLLLSGLKKGNVNVTAVAFNETNNTNQRPSAPTQLNSNIDKNNVSLNWNSGSDDKTPINSLSYSLYLKNLTTGYWHSNPMAFIGTEKDGMRKVTGIGNVSLSKKWHFNDLPEGEYEWSVQAIDASYIGSQFAPMQKFTIGKTGIETVKSDYSIVVKQNGIEVDTNGKLINFIIYSSLGQELSSYQKINGITFFPLNKGVYIIKSLSQGKTGNQKIIIY